MALVKPEIKEHSGDGSKWLGVCEMGIVSFTDRAPQYDWADILLDVDMEIKDSQYNRKLTIKGSFEKDTNGNVESSSVLNRLYHLFGIIGCTAGINIKGEWETEDGEAIKDIAEYLNDNFTSSVIPETAAEHNYVGYVYKRQNPTTKKVYSEVYTRIWPNTNEGTAALESHIKWMKTQGYLKEYTETAPSENNELSKSLSASL